MLLILSISFIITIPSKSYAWQATRLQTRASSTGPLCFGFCVWSPDLLSLEDIDLPLHQHTLSAAIDECLFKQLITMVPSTWARALALSSSLPHAGDWLNVVPSPHLGLNFHHQEFRCCLQYYRRGNYVPFLGPQAVASRAQLGH